MTGYSIRAAGAADIPSMCALEAECFSSPWSEAAFAETMLCSGALFLVCEDENKSIVGYIGAICTLDECSITNICVSAPHRKRGIAVALLSAAERDAADAGAECIFLEVRVSNAAAIALYEKQGYERVGVRRGFYSKPREDAFVYKKAGSARPHSAAYRK